MVSVYTFSVLLDHVGDITVLTTPEPKQVEEYYFFETQMVLGRERLVFSHKTMQDALLNHDVYLRRVNEQLREKTEKAVAVQSWVK